jgi:hypothetical protein
MLDKNEIEPFIQGWVQAWNDRDIQAVAAFYSEKVVYHSPKIQQVMDIPSSTLEGLENLKVYWERALQDAPNLFFEVESHYVSSNALTLTFTNYSGQHVAETFIFDDGAKIAQCVAAYR